VTCPVSGCGRVLVGAPLCARHWLRLPRAERWLLWSGQRSADEAVAWLRAHPEVPASLVAGGGMA
jgi:L-lysine 2,3-aminomutase